MNKIFLTFFITVLVVLNSCSKKVTGNLNQGGTAVNSSVNSNTESNLTFDAQKQNVISTPITTNDPSNTKEEIFIVPKK